jgi:arsenite/tail-anchored protein-transporting ATPase
MLLNDQRIVIVAGKGGVGKTTVAASLAVASANKGLRTLIVSTDPAHSLSDILKCRCNHSPTRILPGLHAIEIDADSLAAGHVAEIAHAMKQYAHPETWPDIDRQLQASLTAPGTIEAALVEYLAGLLSETIESYDRIILDTAPTGHTLRLLSLPDQLGDWTESLLDQRQRHRRMADQPGADESRQHRQVAERLRTRRDRLRAAHDILTDGNRACALVVLTPERLPILESRRLIQGLVQTGIQVAGLIVNGLLPTASNDPFLRRRRELQEVQLAEIDQTLADWPCVNLELSVESPAGTDALGRLGHRILDPSTQSSPVTGEKS